MHIQWWPILVEHFSQEFFFFFLLLLKWPFTYTSLRNTEHDGLVPSKYTYTMLSKFWARLKNKLGGLLAVQSVNLWIHWYTNLAELLNKGICFQSLCAFSDGGWLTLFLSAFTAALMTSLKLVSVVYSAWGRTGHPTWRLQWCSASLCACYINIRLFDGLILWKPSSLPSLIS